MAPTRKTDRRWKNGRVFVVQDGVRYGPYYTLRATENNKRLVIYLGEKPEENPSRFDGLSADEVRRRIG